MIIPTWRVEIITQVEENERLKEQYSLLGEPTTIIVSKQNVRELLIEKSTSDTELQKIFMRYGEGKNDRIEKLIKDFVEYLRKIGYRELKKYVIIELFKQYYRNKVYRRYMSKIYFMRKVRAINRECRYILLLGQIAIKEKAKEKEKKKEKINLEKWAKKRKS